MLIGIIVVVCVLYWIGYRGTPDVLLRRIASHKEMNLELGFNAIGTHVLVDGIMYSLQECREYNLVDRKLVLLGFKRQKQLDYLINQYENSLG